MSQSVPATVPLTEWGRHDTASGGLHFTLGTLTCGVTRERAEWRVEYRYAQDRFVRHSGEATTRLRITGQVGGTEVTLTPIPADRSVVVSPIDPVRIPPSGSATFYVSTPVWVKIVSAAGGITLADVPAQILSDTWFGPNTRTGQLCYANETQARLDRSRVPARFDRIVTPVTITNEGHDLLSIERINLPTTELSVYRSDERLWTEAVHIARERSLDVARLRLDSGPPENLSDPVLVSPPREVPHHDSMARALSSLFR